MMCSESKILYNTMDVCLYLMAEKTRVLDIFADQKLNTQFKI